MGTEAEGADRKVQTVPRHSEISALTENANEMSHHSGQRFPDEVITVTETVGLCFRSLLQVSQHRDPSSSLTSADVVAMQPSSGHHHANSGPFFAALHRNPQMAGT